MTGERAPAPHARARPASIDASAASAGLALLDLGCHPCSLNGALEGRPRRWPRRPRLPTSLVARRGHVLIAARPEHGVGASAAQVGLVLSWPALRRVTKAASDYGAKNKRRLTKQASRLGDVNLGEMEPRVAQRVGVIFSMYVRGCALGLLTGSFGAPRGHSQSPAKQKKKPKASVPPVANDEVRRPSCAPDSSNPLNPFPEPSARSAAFTTTLDEHSGHDDTLDHAAPRSRDGNDLESDRRTVIWHAMSDVLESAFVDKCFIYRGGRLRPYHHATSTSFATADSAAPAPSSGPTQPPPPPPESPWLSRIDSAPTPPSLPHPASRTAKQAGRTSASSVSFGPAKLTAITEPSSSQADGDVREVLATPTVPDEEAQQMRV